VSDQLRVEKLADFGTGEPWVSGAYMGLTQTLVPMVPAFAKGRETFNLEMGEMFMTLGKAFQRLRQIHEMADDVPAIERESAYEDFYGSLWAAYKDRFPRALAALGKDIGFLYQQDAPFEKGAADLAAKQPSYAALVNLMRGYRITFQGALAYYRNEYLEHRENPADPKMLASFLRHDAAQETFDDVWQAIETITASCVVANLPPSLALVEIPESEREKSMPQRFRVTRV